MRPAPVLVRALIFVGFGSIRNPANPAANPPEYVLRFYTFPVIHRFVQNPAAINNDPGTRCSPSDNTYESSATFEKRSRLDEPGKADLDELIASLGLTGTALETYVFDHVDLPSMVD